MQLQESKVKNTQANKFCSNVIKANLGNAEIQYLETWANLVRATGEIEDSTRKRRWPINVSHYLQILYLLSILLLKQVFYSKNTDAKIWSNLYSCYYFDWGDKVIEYKKTMFLVLTWTESDQFSEKSWSVKSFLALFLFFCSSK